MTRPVLPPRNKREAEELLETIGRRATRASLRKHGVTRELAFAATRPGRARQLVMDYLEAVVEEATEVMASISNG